MRSSNPAARIFAVLLTLFVSFTVLSTIAHGQNASLGSGAKSVMPPLVQQMIGTWNVQQRMWPGAAAAAINLPPAIARRRLVEGAFLEEEMELAPGSKETPFTRNAYFNYNTVNQQYEYFSIDSRGPQMMNEKSHGVSNEHDAITLYGDSFVAPRWGEAINAAFRYRLTIGQVEKDRQVVQLYLTPQSTENAKEFLAFEYVYTREH